MGSGYLFAHPSLSHVFPLESLDDRIASLEQNGVFVPLSLKIWYKMVGTVNLMGSHPSWRAPGYLKKTIREKEIWYTDPLVVDDFFDETYKNWRYQMKDAPEGYIQTCCIEIAPDVRHKANISGGASYEMSIEKPSIDTLLRNEVHNVNFVDYYESHFGGVAFRVPNTFPIFPWISSKI